MIPKVIHYMWFGGNPLPDSVNQYVETWKRFCPDYEIKRWDESNFDIHCCRYVEEAYAVKKWAFVSDYARFWVLYNYGGIYFDTDIEVVRSIDSLLKHKAFFGFGDSGLTLPVFGAQAGQESYNDILEDYNKRSFILDDKTYDLTTIDMTALRILKASYGLVENGNLQTLQDGTVVYPKQFFYAYNTETGVMKKYPELYVIHHADGSWITEKQKFYMHLKRKCASVFGGGRLSLAIAALIYYLRTEGIKGTIYKCISVMKK